MALPNMASLGPAGADEILRPARPWFIVATLIAGLLANLVPLNGLALALRPDFLALVLLYWCIQAPRYVGVGIAWCVGLVMDVGDATLFGQHAFAYAFLAYAAEYFRRRVLRFPLVAAGGAGRRAALPVRGAGAPHPVRRWRAAAAAHVSRRRPSSARCSGR